MSKRLSHFYYTAIAFVMTYVGALFSEHTFVFAAVCPTRTVFQTYSTTCGPGNYVTTTPGLRCGSGLGNICSSYGQPGWSCVGNVVSGANESAWCSCSSSYLVNNDSPITAPVNCGTATSCNGTKIAATCNRGPVNAGYLVAGTSCQCCPTGLATVYSAYNATAATDCYTVGTTDEYGLFEYTNGNTCYYAS